MLLPSCADLVLQDRGGSTALLTNLDCATHQSSAAQPSTHRSLWQAAEFPSTHHMQQLGQRNANHKAEGKKLSSQIVCSCGLRAANPLPTAAPRSRAAHTHTHTHHLPATGDAQQHVSSSVSTVSAPQTPPAHARISQRCSSRGRQAASLLSADAAQKHGLQTQGQRCHTACRCQADGANPLPCRG